MWRRDSKKWDVTKGLTYVYTYTYMMHTYSPVYVLHEYVHVLIYSYWCAPFIHSLCHGPLHLCSTPHASPVVNAIALSNLGNGSLEYGKSPSSHIQHDMRLPYAIGFAFLNMGNGSLEYGEFPLSHIQHTTCASHIQRDMAMSNPEISAQKIHGTLASINHGTNTWMNCGTQTWITNQGTRAWIIHGAHVNESWHTVNESWHANVDELWRTHAYKSQHTHVNEAWHTVNESWHANMNESWRTHVNESKHTHVNEAWHTVHESWDTNVNELWRTHVYESQHTLVNEAWYANEKVMTHVRISHVTHVGIEHYTSTHARRAVMPHTCRSRGAILNELWRNVEGVVARLYRGTTISNILNE